MADDLYGDVRLIEAAHLISQVADEGPNSHRVAVNNLLPVVEDLAKSQPHGD